MTRSPPTQVRSHGSGFARVDINKHVNGCGLVWTNHTESAPRVGTKALHDNLAWTARSGLPHLARTSHAPMARRRRHRAYLLRRSAAISHGRVRQLLPVIAAARSAPVRARRAPDMRPELGKTRTCASTNAGLAPRTGCVPQFANTGARRAVDRPPPQPTGPEALVSRECGYAQTSAAGPIRGPAFMPREASRPHPAGPCLSPQARISGAGAESGSDTGSRPSEALGANQHPGRMQASRPALALPTLLRSGHQTAVAAKGVMRSPDLPR